MCVTLTVDAVDSAGLGCRSRCFKVSSVSESSLELFESNWMSLLSFFSLPVEVLDDVVLRILETFSSDNEILSSSLDLFQ